MSIFDKKPTDPRNRRSSIYHSSFYTEGVAGDDIMRDFEKYGV